MKVFYYDRYKKDLFEEKIYGEKYLRWLYGNPVGRFSLWLIIKRAFFSFFYGFLMKRPGSVERISSFIRKYEVVMDDFEKNAFEFDSFNDFFVRKLKKGVRNFKFSSKKLCFPVDGRHFLLKDCQNEDFLVKNNRFNLADFLQNEDLSSCRASVLVSRLCPMDYHRFHFPCDGRAGKAKILSGGLFSVNPIALMAKPQILWQNKRVLIPFSSEVFGKFFLVLVGATCVGGIHLTYKPDLVKRGEEFGYFDFGASTLVCVFFNMELQFAQDLIVQSKKNIELYAKMGDYFAKI